ncbi:hypothetical protein CEUSTIGMA_g11603.t1 [Chlamydomonas eustigma]|uniref:Expansin-like EG45 domain-containing protein n=1 Tax=Chlamydomonas eustigma TaxID=1157962 RepID=A0A250XMZ5_9CHLO|nr:hypothetical protein CEUSTIGMA_g11603.t1 [Chlamydomonas eustigma]|eukprot:GAX84180.1 hypothetical protein CEUSTIGMA_g11603.t1 [Chlamydomonas eustigma]
MTFKDNFGQWLDRQHDCLSQESVVVTITDTCPCVKPNNAYSNKRWCCGDMNHLDLGVWAFKQIADPGKGVVGIQYRPVSCSSSTDSIGASNSSSVAGGPDSSKKDSSVEMMSGSSTANMVVTQSPFSKPPVAPYMGANTSSSVGDVTSLIGSPARSLP